ncbi:MAG: hypothetical protein EOP09_18555 [Proteobacteria bacterium]|nr:MAG: hypothetical protein EOP09_18555 [Pseudomonadota bacterium]
MLRTLSVLAATLGAISSSFAMSARVDSSAFTEQGTTVRLDGRDYQVIAINADTGEVVDASQVASETEIHSALAGDPQVVQPLSAKGMVAPKGVKGYGEYYSPILIGVEMGTESRSAALRGSNRSHPILGGRNTSFYTNIRVSKMLGDYSEAGAIAGISTDFTNSPFQAGVTDYNLGGFIIIGLPVGYGGDGTENVLGFGIEAGAKFQRKNFLGEDQRPVQGFVYPTISYEFSRGEDHTFTKTVKLSPGMTLDGIQQQFMALKLGIVFKLNR